MWGKKSQINSRDIQSVLNGFCFLTKKCVQTCKAMYKLNPRKSRDCTPFIPRSKLWDYTPSVFSVSL